MLLAYPNGIHRASLPADIAFGTQDSIYFMLFVWIESNGINGALLCANGTSNAIVVHAIAHQGLALTRGAMAVDVRLVFIMKES